MSKSIEIVLVDDEAAENLGYEVHLSPKVSDEEREGFIGQAERQISLFLKMAEITYEMKIVK